PPNAIGLRQRCSHRDANGQPVAPPGRAEVIEAALAALRAANNMSTAQMLQQTILDFQNSENDPGTGRAQILADFNALNFTNPEALEVAECQQQFEQVQEFTAQRLRELLELQDQTGFTERFDGRGLRQSVDTLSAYPIMTTDAGDRVASSTSTASAAP